MVPDIKLHNPTLNWLDSQSESMLTLVKQWSEINSHTFNLAGLKILAQEIGNAFHCFDEKIEFLDIPRIKRITLAGSQKFQSLGQAIKIQKRPAAPKQVLLMIHMDTVYPPKQNFPVEKKAENILQGPGVADAKGGLVVMLKALEAFERTAIREKLGWTVFINPDEEIGSPGSQKILKTLTAKVKIGLLFEPCLPNGNLVGDRSGSGNFSIVVHGRAAHVGRDYTQGRNAISILMKLLETVQSLARQYDKCIINVGVINGGTAANVVPDTAVAELNVRLNAIDDQMKFQKALERIMADFPSKEGASIEWHGGFSSSPKIMTAETLNLYRNLKQCGEEIGLKIDWEHSHGVSDGNRLSAWGIPNIDTLGVCGDGIHSPREFLFIDSLTQRAKLTALFLLKWAASTAHQEF